MGFLQAILMTSENSKDTRQGQPFHESMRGGKKKKSQQHKDHSIKLCQLNCRGHPATLTWGVSFLLLVVHSSSVKQKALCSGFIQMISGRKRFKRILGMKGPGTCSYSTHTTFCSGGNARSQPACPEKERFLFFFFPPLHYKWIMAPVP